jgi:hypothetical protein
MRHLLLFILLLKPGIFYCQSDSAVFDRDFRFRTGIYTSYREVLENAPKYPDCSPEIKVDPWFGRVSLNYYDRQHMKNPLPGDIFACAHSGEIYIWYAGRFNRLIMKGAISAFYDELVIDYMTGYSESYYKTYFVDLETGNIERMYPENVDGVIQRDSLLFAEYSKLSYPKKRKILYSYILKYNSRNPF